MLTGHEIYISGTPCPMCMSAIYWSRIDGVYFGDDLEETSSKIGFDDAFQYEDFTRPYSQRRVKIGQFRPDLAEVPYKAWAQKKTTSTRTDVGAVAADRQPGAAEQG